MFNRFYKVRIAIFIVIFLSITGCVPVSHRAHIPQSASIRSSEQPYTPKVAIAQSNKDNFTLDESMSVLITQIVNSMIEENKKKIAVTDFSTIDGKVTPFGKYIAEELITKLFMTRKFDVIERRLLNKILEEQKLSLSGLIDQTTAQEIGKILGVDAIVTGTITDLGTSLKVNARIISTESGKVFAVASIGIIKDDAVKKLMLGIEKAPPQTKLQTSSGTSKKKINYTKPKGNLIVNGNFREHWTNGWKRTLGDITKGSSKVSVVTIPTEPGRAVKITHKGESHVLLYQSIPVINAKLRFSASFQMITKEGPIIGFSGTGIAMISLIYYNNAGNIIGKTTFCQFVKNPFADTGLIGVPKGPQDSNLEHYIKVGSGWQHRTIDVEREIVDNLPGINPEDVKKIVVVLLAGATGSEASAILYVTNLCLEYK